MAKEILKNGSTLEITSSKSGFTVSSEAIKPKSSVRTGKLSEKKRFIIKGRAEKNKPTNIGELKLSAAENKRFIRTPSISKSSDKGIVLNSKITLRLKSVDRDTKNRITAYTYDMIYTGKESVSAINPLKYKINSKTISLVNKVTGIEKIICGGDGLSVDGERRRITLHGTPGTTFKIAVTKIEVSRYNNIYADVDDGSGDVATTNPIINMIETDILNSAYSNSTENLSTTGVEMSIISDKIPRSGKYSFIQSFPKLELVRATAINESGAANGATRIIFDDLTDVIAGDIVTINGLTTTVQTVNPTGGNANQCDLTNTMTGADNTHAEFRRISRYSVNILPNKLKRRIPSSYFTINRKGWEGGWYSKILKHMFTPKLVLRATSNNVLYTINRYTIPDGASTQTYDRRFSKKTKNNLGRNNYHKVVYTLRALSSSHSFSSLKTPAVTDFGTSAIRSSKTNGGTLFEIQNLSAPVLSNTQGWANDTATITFYIRIKSWGETDVVLETALNTFVNCS